MFSSEGQDPESRTWLDFRGARFGIKARKIGCMFIVIMLCMTQK